MAITAAPIVSDSTPAINLKRDAQVIIASSLGTVFEWYDFFVYITVAKIIAANFFPSTNPTASLLSVLLVYGAGFGMRPFGAAFFGVMGDRLGRKFTFLMTITLMGAATAALGLVPSYAQIGIAAPVILVALRLLQGLALGGEYGGAAIYVAEHAPANRRGLYTSFVQASVVGGLILSLIVVLSATAIVGPVAWQQWGWRIPFWLSVLLLAISLWIRLQLKESPVFQAMKASEQISGNPLAESFATWRKSGRIVAAMIGVAAGLTVIWYTAQLYALAFLQNSLRLDDRSAWWLILIGAVISLVWFVGCGWLSDKIGRKIPILLGYGLTLLTLFPLFHLMADGANPSLSQAISKAPIVVIGSDCSYSPFATKQATPCGAVLDLLAQRGLPYKVSEVADMRDATVTIASIYVDVHDPRRLDAALNAAGYDVDRKPARGSSVQVIVALVLLSLLSGLTYGPVAAYLVELFPARVRYTSLSIPYHVGTGYFGGFLPFITQYMVARSGNPYQGLWYTMGIVGVAFIVLLVALPETMGKELD